jgi:hypothetical protein
VWLTVIGKDDLKHRYQSNSYFPVTSINFGEPRSWDEEPVLVRAMIFRRYDQGFKLGERCVLRETIGDRRFRQWKVLLGFTRVQYGGD